MRFTSRALALAAALAGLVAACAKPTPTNGAPDGATSSRPPDPAAGGRCDAKDCATCSAGTACRWCTEPRACIAAGSPCGGLALGHPSTCANDPQIGGSPRARALDQLRESFVVHLRDMAPSGVSIDARLETLTSLAVPIPAGTCYSLVWSVGEDARPSNATFQLDFRGPKGSQGPHVLPIGLAGWSGRSCTSVAGNLMITVVDSETFERIVPAGAGKINFTLYARARAASDTDEGGGPPILAQDPPPATTTPPGARRGGPPPRGGRAPGVDCQDCTFPCESSKRDCERRCFVSERDMGARRTCERVCEQIGRACLRGCPGCI